MNREDQEAVTLNSRWHRWKNRRARTLRQEGMKATLAISLADGEARARQRLSRLIGFRAAESAALICEGDRFFLTGDVHQLNDPQIVRLARSEGVTISKPI